MSSSFPNYHEKIRSLRLDKNLTQEEFAAVIDISQAQLSYIESGKREVNDQLKIKISNYFGIPIEQLFFSDY